MPAGRQQIWNPMQVGLGAAQSGPWTRGAASRAPQNTILATGTGPYDPAYRQNLAIYAGGQLANPGGVMGFNPTQLSSYPGAPTGGGNAPLPGMPTTLLQQATLGQGFSAPKPQFSQAATNNFQQDWLNNYLRGGQGYQSFAADSNSLT